MAKASNDGFQPLSIAVMTVSDTRTREDDTSGGYLQESLQQAGHDTADRVIVPDDIYKIIVRHAKVPPAGPGASQTHHI